MPTKCLHRFIIVRSLDLHDISNGTFVLIIVSCWNVLSHGSFITRFNQVQIKCNMRFFNEGVTLLENTFNKDD